MAVRDALPAPLPTSTLGTIARRVARLPFAVSLATLWLVLMVVIALGADFLLPYSITAFDLKARLAPPVLFGGTFAHPLGTDELGRDVLLAADHVDPHEPADRPVRHADRRDPGHGAGHPRRPFPPAMSRR